MYLPTAEKPDKSPFFKWDGKATKLIVQVPMPSETIATSWIVT